MGRKHCGKRRNCSLRASSPFPTVFSKDLYYRHVKTRACLEKGQYILSYIYLFQIAIYCLPYIQSCLNPVIYGLMSENFRKGVIASCQHPLEHLRKSRQNIELGEFEMESKLNNGTVQTLNSRTARNSNENDSFMAEEY